MGGGEGTHIGYTQGTRGMEKGIIVKLPKKGDLTVCSDRRGINLLSVPRKIPF